MRVSIALFGVGFLIASVTGCAGFYRAPVIPSAAMVYTNFKAPLDIDYDETQVGSKEGRASVSSILGVVAWGDASIEAAAKNGGITTIRNADYEFTNVLGVYSNFTTIVTGD